METTVADANHSLLLDLPNELFTLILLRLPTSALVSLSLTCTQCHRFIADDANLVWRDLYLRNWDQVEQQNLVNASHSVDSKGKGKARQLDGDDTAEFTSSDLSPRELIARRRRARRDLAKSTSNPVRLLQNYTNILDELLEVQQSIRPTTSGAFSRSVASLRSMFPQNQVGDARWQALVYPRELASIVKEWQQREGASSAAGKQLSSVSRERKSSLRRTASDATDVAAKRQKVQGEGSKTNEDATRKPTSRAASRRSARVLAKAAPKELHRLDLDADQLATLATMLHDFDLDPEKAAELHCKTGLRRTFLAHRINSEVWAMSKEQKGATKAAAAAKGEPEFRPDEQGDLEEQVASESTSTVDEVLYEDYGTNNVSPEDYQQSLMDVHQGIPFLGYPQNPRFRTQAKEIVYDVGRSSYETGHGPLKAFRPSPERPPRAGNVLTQLANHWAEDDEGEGGYIDEVIYLSDVEDGQPFSDSDEDEDELQGLMEEEGEAAAAMMQAEQLVPGADQDMQHGSDDEDEDDDDSEDDDESPWAEEDVFPWGHRGATDFARMVAEVSAYAGSKARNDLEDFTNQSNGQKTTLEGGTTSSNGGSPQKCIDWILLEAIMIVVYSNLTEVMEQSVWGMSFSLPERDSIERIPSGGTEMLARKFRTARIFDFPQNWAMTRSLPPPRPQDDSKVYDWAGVERTFAGSYFFLDYSVFLRYNAHLANSPNGTIASSNCPHFNLGDESEATGDTLELRLSLRPLAEQKPEFEEGEEEFKSHGLVDDLQFPTLRFEGQTLTYLPDQSAGIPRGRAHGFCRPIYAADGKLTRYHSATNTWLPEISGIYWKIIHRYEGSDRWSLSGVQVGCPGTTAPIMGLWSDIEDEDGSPIGPFTYLCVDERPWTEVEECRREAIRRGQRTTA